MNRIEIELRSSNRSTGKCGVYGCGRTGIAIAYAIMKSGYCRDLVLADPEPQKAKREADLLAGALPFCSQTDVYAGDESELADCGVIVFAPESDGDEPTLAALLCDTARRITAEGTEPILLNATHPMERVTQMLQEASGLSPGRVFGVGCVTECVRLRKMLGRHLGVSSAAVSVFLMGGGAEGTIPLWSRANVAGIALSEYCAMCGRGYDVGVMDGLFRAAFEQSRKNPYTVAESVRRIYLGIVRDENVILPLTCPVQGQYGLEGISLCMPSVIGRLGVRRILEIPLNDTEERHLHRVAQNVRRG